MITILKDRGNKPSLTSKSMLSAMRKKTFSSCLQKRKVIPFCFKNHCLSIGLGPNVDFFSIDELEALAKKFKE
jgi:hypothetical protein